MKRLLSEERISRMMLLYPGKSKKEVEGLLYRELRKKLGKALFTGGVLFVLALVLTGREQKAREMQTVTRPGYGLPELIQKIQIEGSNGWKEAELIISATEMTEEELAYRQEAAERYLDEVVLAENEDFSCVKQNLYFPEEVPGKFPVNWSTDVPGLIDGKGQVKNAGLEKERTVTITGKILYGTEFFVYERRITVWPKEYSQEEQKLLAVMQELIRREEEGRQEETFILPEEINGKRIKISKEKGLSAGTFIGVLAILLPPAAYYGYINSLEKRKKKQEEQAINGYTEFVTRLSLLLVAGNSVRDAFGRLAKEYADTYGNNYILTKELTVTCRELSNGCAEATAYERFGDRFGLVPYRRLASLLVQSNTKGVQNLRRLLLEETKEVMAEERVKIKIRGEQAGTKLLVPMMGFLVLIFAILLVPAFGMF